jgi:hypothetical protein
MLCTLQCTADAPAVVQVREGYSVLCSDLMSNDDLIDIIKLIPVLLICICISKQWLKLWATCDHNTQKHDKIQCSTAIQAHDHQSLHLLSVTWMLCYAILHVERTRTS